MAKLNEKQKTTAYSIVAFLVAVFISAALLHDYSILYNDKCYADMITCTDNMNLQVYDTIMRPFSNILSVSEILSGDEQVNPGKHKALTEIMKENKLNGIIYAPNNQITYVNSEEFSSSFLGLEITEFVKQKYIEEMVAPTIVGPFNIPGTNKEIIGVMIAIYKNSPEGKKYNGAVMGYVYFPEIFSNIDFGILKEKNMLCRVWRYDDSTGKVITILETPEGFPDKINRNFSNFTKMYFRSSIVFSMVSKNTVFQTSKFFILVVFLFFFSVILSASVFMMIKGLRTAHELKYYKVQSKLLKIQEHTIISLSSLVENRDSDTGEHVRRTSAYVYMLAQEAKKAGLFTDVLTDDYVENLKNAAPMHDIGKIVVPDAVLKKPGKLTDEEFEQIKQHAVQGGKIIQDIMGPVQTKEFVKISKEIAESHHEKWNGKGYPYGLKENEIPLSARIMALADVFDALTTPRCYKDPFPFEKAIEIIKNDSGIHFDPQLTEVFLNNQDKLKEIMGQF